MLIPLDVDESGRFVYVNHLYVTHVESLDSSNDYALIYIVGRKEPIRVMESVCDVAGLLDVDCDEEEESD